MLSPLDLQNKKVQSIKKKYYYKDEMDEYLELIFLNYKEAYNENQELHKKMKTLSDGIQYYRTIESTMQKALVLAEKTSKETKDAAELKAEAIEKEAQTKANKIITNAEQEYEHLKEKCSYLISQFNQYKLQLKQVAQAQFELVTSENFDVYAPELEAVTAEALPVNDVIDTNYSQTDNSAMNYSNSSDVNYVNNTYPNNAQNNYQNNSKDNYQNNSDNYSAANDNYQNNGEAYANNNDNYNNNMMNNSNSSATDYSNSNAYNSDNYPNNSANYSQNESQKNNGYNNDSYNMAPSNEEYNSYNKDMSKEEDDDDLGKTRVLPNVKDKIKQDNMSVSEEQNILSAETVDLSSPINEARRMSGMLNNNKKNSSKQAKENSNSNANNTNQLKPNKSKQPEILEPVPQKNKETQTLDSLLQDMNMSKKRKNNGAKDEDPFEFLGSVDDF